MLTREKTKYIIIKQEMCKKQSENFLGQRIIGNIVMFGGEVGSWKQQHTMNNYARNT